MRYGQVFLVSFEFIKRDRLILGSHLLMIEDFDNELLLE